FCQLTVYRNFNGFCFLISHFLLFLPTFSAEDSNGIVKKGNNVQIIIGMKVQSVREDVCQILHMD
ncbi:MAG: hypothetical protein KH451_08950, partial [Holdemanella biformis]|nr:hypothetical protein [Holdemanella biformis]